MSTMSVCRSPLSATAVTFHLLTCPPFPLGLPGVLFDPGLGLPTGFLPLPTLGRWLRAEQRDQPARLAVWRVLVGRAQGGDPAWRVAAVHMAARQIRRHARLLAAHTHCLTWAAQADVIEGLVRSIDTGAAADVDWLA